MAWELNGTAASAGQLQAMREDLGVAGKVPVPVDAGAMQPATTNGCSLLTNVEINGAGKPEVLYLAFDGSSQEYAVFSLKLDEHWDPATTLTFKAEWMHLTTASGYGVAWGLQAVAVGNDDALDVAFGTAVYVTDTGGTVKDVYETAESSAVTVAGSPAAGDRVFFRVTRDPANGSDTMNGVDACLIGLTIYITTTGIAA